MDDDKSGRLVDKIQISRGKPTTQTLAQAPKVCVPDTPGPATGARIAPSTPLVYFESERTGILLSRRVRPLQNQSEQDPTRRDRTGSGHQFVHHEQGTREVSHRQSCGLKPKITYGLISACSDHKARVMFGRVELVAKHWHEIQRSLEICTATSHKLANRQDTFARNLQL